MTFHSIVTVALGCFQINVDVVTGSSVTGFMSLAHFIVATAKQTGNNQTHFPVLLKYQ